MDVINSVHIQETGISQQTHTLHIELFSRMEPSSYNNFCSLSLFQRDNILKIPLANDLFSEYDINMYKFNNIIPS